MSIESQLQEIYQEIAETVNNMIPEEWEKFYFYAQISETGGGTYFFYNCPQEQEYYHYSLDIPDRFPISLTEFNKEKEKLFDLSAELRNIFKEHNQELWYSFTMGLDREGKLSISFDYTDWFNTDYDFNEQLTLWEFKYLNNIPEDEESKELIKRYLDEYPHNPI